MEGMACAAMVIARKGENVVRTVTAARGAGGLPAHVTRSVLRARATRRTAAPGTRQDRAPGPGLTAKFLVERTAMFAGVSGSRIRIPLRWACVKGITWSARMSKNPGAICFAAAPGMPRVPAAERQQRALALPPSLPAIPRTTAAGSAARATPAGDRRAKTAYTMDIFHAMDV